MQENPPSPFTARSATMDDVEAVVELLNACSLAETGEREAAVHAIRTDWQAPTFSLETDTQVVVAPGGEVVGHVALWDSEPHLRIHATVDVHPDYQGKDIGTALARWAEARARRSVPKAADGARVVLWQTKASSNRVAHDLLLAQGYRLVRQSLRMRIEMDARPERADVPEGLTIRPFIRGQEERALVRAMREAFRDHWGVVEQPFEEDYQEWMHFLENDPLSDPSLWFVAVDEETGDIAGTSLCYPRTADDEDMGWIFGLGVRRPWRRRGLGLALLRHCFGALYERGKRRVGLGVDAESLTGATRLYEKAGMTVYRQYGIYEKELVGGAS